MIELRDYQEECVKRVLASYATNPSATELIVLPTGGGKTIVFSSIIELLNKQHGLAAIVVAHRDELLDQAADKYRMVKPSAVIGKIGSGQHQYGGELTVAGIATISRPEHIRKLKALYGTGQGLILTIDEAHHVAAQGYQEVLEAFPDAFKLFVTATPDRLDNKPILPGKKPLFEKFIIDMIQEGYLCNLKCVAVKTQVSLDGLHTLAGDFKPGELEDAIDTPARNARVVESYKEHANGRRSICFGVTVAHAQNLARAFTEQGVPAATVSGETPLDERKQLYTALRNGTIRVLTNVQVLTEGYDEPLVDCIIMARPTQSRALYVQCIGRGLRLAPAKKDCIILDITDNCLTHRLEPQSLAKVLGKRLKPDETLTEAIEREASENAEREAQVRKLKTARDKDLEIDLLQKLIWQEKMDGKFVLEVGREKHRIALIPSGQGDGMYSVYARLFPGYEPQEWSGNQPLDWAQQLAEKKARMLLADPKAVGLVDRNASWRNQPASPAQLEKLEKYKRRFKLVYDPMTVTKGQAADLLDPVFESFKQWHEAKKAKATA